MRISHVGWNFAGLSLPLLIAVVTIPKLLANLGQERFGLLTLAWGLIGYAGALDLGIGRAATLYISRLKVGSNSDINKIPVVLGTGVRITLVTGGIAAVLISLISFSDIIYLLKINNVIPSELRNAILLLALALPLQAISATYRGVNEAYLKFKGVSFLRVFLGCANFGLPWVVSLYTLRLEWLILSLVISRFLALFFYRVLAYSCFEEYSLSKNKLFSVGVAKELLRFGGWFTLSGVLNPLVATADRFIISALISAAAVSLYVIPYEMAAQSLILIGAVTTVTFPYFSQLIVENPQRVKRFFLKVTAISALVMLVVTLTFILFGDEILFLWLKSNANEESIKILKMLSLGLIPYTVGTLSVSLLHAYGRSEVTAKLNLLEFPVFLCLVYFFVEYWGLVGAAYAWITRVTLDAVLMSFIINKLLKRGEIHA
ncbi:oligosaccharide flippase family protein [Comamonas resistens]|uniref:oligosaccharide flippase family protein n=1 Tax=Comamonas resistens TaxID=3046670 RepID=UPI0039BD725B